MSSVNKLELAQFMLLVDNEIEQLQKVKATKKVTVKSDSILPELVGGKIGNKMIALQNNETKEFIVVYSNAAICAKKHELNPTTIRQRAGGKKVDDKNRIWQFMDEAAYKKLILKTE